jgi:hypothetical protein
MAGTLNSNAHASASEIRSLTVVAQQFPAKWTVELREPSGGRGGGGGSTSDLVVYQGGSVGSTYTDGDLDNETVAATIDVFTPETAEPQAVATAVRKKLSSQADGVCVDLINVTGLKRTSTRSALEKLAGGTKGFIIVHAPGDATQVYGKLPGK